MTTDQQFHFRVRLTRHDPVNDAFRHGLVVCQLGHISGIPRSFQAVCLQSLSNLSCTHSLDWLSVSPSVKEYEGETYESIFLGSSRIDCTKESRGLR